MELAEIDTFGAYSVVLPEEPHVFGVRHIPRREVPIHITRPPYASSGVRLLDGLGSVLTKGDGIIALGSPDEARLRASARLARDVLHFARTLVRVHVTTDEIDAQVHRFIVSHGAYPSPLNYKGFPKSCCTSVNNVIVHGIPDQRVLKDGDIINIDITVYLDGYHGDTSDTFLVGEVDEPGRRLIESTATALEIGIAACGPGRPLKAIGAAISALASQRGYSIAQFDGHGIGTEFHRPPYIVHHRNDEPGFMQPGHCFTIEPALVQGSNPRSWTFPDGWTESTINCARSAQKEHMVLITKDGVDVLTA
ncbi:methionyl aminopeptidase [Vararia minispora EC-137]|uniref:Methionyl aminopeptidase n=1 Tax=Vararia minispora EC-137 TaxID=1314806 RepID=A0ACB8QRD2_9AGAM|nr:methionyl aminopeptidase [Vararia minispora EC-137]